MTPIEREPMKSWCEDCMGTMDIPPVDDPSWWFSYDDNKDFAFMFFL